MDANETADRGAGLRPGALVSLLVELGAGPRYPVHEIGSRARVLFADGDRVVVAVGEGMTIDVFECLHWQVSPVGQGSRAHPATTATEQSRRRRMLQRQDPLDRRELVRL